MKKTCSPRVLHIHLTLNQWCIMKLTSDANKKYQQTNIVWRFTKFSRRVSWNQSKENSSIKIENGRNDNWEEKFRYLTAKEELVIRDLIAYLSPLCMMFHIFTCIWICTKHQISDKYGQITPHFRLWSISFFFINAKFYKLVAFIIELWKSLLINSAD